MNVLVDVDFGAFARTFQALADAKRVEIVTLLTHGERCVCELTDVVGAKQPLLSFHLKILREAGIVKNRRRGKWMYYSLNYQKIDELKELIGTMAIGREHADACGCESICCPNTSVRLYAEEEDHEAR
jgi:ArsR family transcriptional regulator